jgi:hypothetical protein
VFHNETKLRFFLRSAIVFSVLTFAAMSAGGLGIGLLHRRAVSLATTAAYIQYADFQNSVIIFSYAMILITLLLWAVTMACWCQVRR